MTTQLTEDVRALLDAPNFAHLATVRADGSPHSVPVWVMREGERIVFFTQTTSAKAKNLERDGRVALSLSDHANPYRAAWIRGRVVERRADEAIWETIDRMAKRYTGKAFPWRSPTSVLYAIEVERAGFYALPFEPPAAPSA